MSGTYIDLLETPGYILLSTVADRPERLDYQIFDAKRLAPGGTES